MLILLPVARLPGTSSPCSCSPCCPLPGFSTEKKPRSGHSCLPARSTRFRRENLTLVQPSSAPLVLDSMMQVNTEWERLDSLFMLVSPKRRFSVPLRITFRASSTAVTAHTYTCHMLCAYGLYTSGRVLLLVSCILDLPLLTTFDRCASLADKLTLYALASTIGAHLFCSSAPTSMPQTCIPALI